MSQRAHEQAAELHNLAAHAHAAAAVAHGKEDHLTAHELSKQAHEHSMKCSQAYPRVRPENRTNSRCGSCGSETVTWSLLL